MRFEVNLAIVTDVARDVLDVRGKGLLQVRVGQVYLLAGHFRASLLFYHFIKNLIFKQQIFIYSTKRLKFYKKKSELDRSIFLPDMLELAYCFINYKNKIRILLFGMALYYKQNFLTNNHLSYKEIEIENNEIIF